ncbi:alpha/beta hydrolase family protein [Acidobacteriota bacterium]
MSRNSLFRKTSLFALLLSLFFTLGFAETAEKKTLTLLDVMKFKTIQDPVISENGNFLAYTIQPDRGDGEVKIHDVRSGKAFTIERGASPALSKDSLWVATVVNPGALELEKAGEKKPKKGMALLDTREGEITRFENVERFVLSDNSMWLAFLHFKEEEEEKEEQTKKPEEESGTSTEAVKTEIGSTLILRKLNSGEEIKIPFVLFFDFDGTSRYLAYVIADPEEKDNGLYLVELGEEDLPRKTVIKSEKGHFSSLAWTKQERKLAFLSSGENGGNSENREASLWIWENSTQKANQVLAAEDVPEGWFIPEKNELSWSKDEKRLFFGFKPVRFLHLNKEEKKEKAEIGEADLFDTETILEKREVDVWHWNDPFINPHQKKLWPQTKDKTYLSVYFLDSGRIVSLADEDMPGINFNENPQFALGISDVPYRKQRTWYGRLNDVYYVDLKDGSRQKVAARLEDRYSLSPNGRFVVYYLDKHWYLYDGKTGDQKSLTENMDVPFFNEDHDYPRKAPSYGIAGWVESDTAVLIYEKYDIWMFSTDTGQGTNMTGRKGRENMVTYRVLNLDPEKDSFKKDQKLLLSAYSNREKHFGFYACKIGESGVDKLLEGEKRFRFIAKAKKADALIYSRESYEEFPDLWISDLRLSSPKKISDVNPQISEFLWGRPELVEWSSVDGLPLQGVLIKPENYEQGKRYPVIVYFYRFFSQRLYEFNQPVVNHRPCFPLYTSNGYAIFLPDIRFDVGFPGYAATKCLVPGVQKLIEMGIADPKAVGLHGHSWSGYQTAFVITQTNLFAAAIAGAPVSNMTSAYSGIRWATGLARQFQYEKTQSRIGGSLWEYLERYVENSPVFFADRIHTPLLIMFGDEDGAVPWYQGIELYLAMRRLEKDCIFLQYRGEPHHLQKYPNKLDYAKKMKEYFDSYLKKAPAPDWITKGIPYRGNE